MIKKSFLKKKNPLGGQPIKRLVHESIAGWEDARPINKIHASSLTYAPKPFCPRAFVIMRAENKKPKAEFISTSLRVTFDHGNDMQARLNEQYLRDRMVGNWKCHSCGKTKKLCRRPKGDSCVHGKASITCQWRYEEVVVSNKQSGVVGSVDALINISLPKLRLTEVKTMVKDQFKVLLAPMAEHSLRTKLYLKLMADSEHPFTGRVQTDVASVFYMVKGFGIKDEQIKEWGIQDQAFSPFKEFEVTRDDDAVRWLLSKAKTVAVYKKTGKTPCKICATAFDPTAKNCSVVKLCFGAKYSQDTTWRGGDGELVHAGKEEVIYED